MCRANIERGLMLVGAALLVLFVLSFSVSTLEAWNDEIRLATVGAVILYGAYSFWSQPRDSQDLASQPNDALKRENEQLRRRVVDLEQALKAAQSAEPTAATSSADNAD